jgi:hypothetical protein
MWKCRHCGLELATDAVKPEVDSEGCHFICPGCDGRNELVNAGGLDQEDSIVWVQPDI